MDNTGHSSTSNSNTEKDKQNPIGCFFGGIFSLLIYYGINRTLLGNSTVASLERFRMQWQLFFIGLEDIKFLELHWLALAFGTFVGWGKLSELLLNAYCDREDRIRGVILERTMGIVLFIPWFLFYACGAWLGSQYALNSGVPSGAAQVRGASSWVYPLAQIPVCVWEFRDRSIAETVSIYLRRFEVHPSSLPEKRTSP